MLYIVTEQTFFESDQISTRNRIVLPGDAEDGQTRSRRSFDKIKVIKCAHCNCCTPCSLARGRNRQEKSDEWQSGRSSLDEDGHRHREQVRMHTSSVALLKWFDLGDMPGILSAWSVRTCECRNARKLGSTKSTILHCSQVSSPTAFAPSSLFLSRTTTNPPENPPLQLYRVWSLKA